MKGLYPLYSDSVEFLAVDIDPYETLEQIRRYQERNEFPWMMAPAERGMTAAYGVTVQSTKFAINGNGVITSRRGYGTGSARDWQKLLEDLASSSE